MAEAPARLSRVARPAPPPPKKCKQHNEVLDLFCFTCTKLICKVCGNGDHRQHKYKPKKEAAFQCRKTLRERTDSLQQALTKIKASTKASKDALDDNLKAVSETITLSIDEMIGTLIHREQQLLDEASALAREKQAALDAQKESSAVSLDEAQSLVDEVDQSLKNHDEQQSKILRQIARVEESYRNLQHIDQQPAAEANIHSDMTVDDQVLRTVGCVGLDEGDTIKCTIKGAYPKAIINEATKLTFHLTDSTNSSCSHPFSVKAEVRSLIDDSIIPTTIFHVGDGTYRATYTPRIRGGHTMTVRVNMKDTIGGPFLVFVQAQPEEPAKRMKGLKGPVGIAISNDNEVLVAEFDGGEVSVFDKQGGKTLTIQHKNLPHPNGVATDHDGNIYISSCNDTVVKFSKDGMPLQLNKSLGPYLYLIQVISGKIYICSREDILLVECENLRLLKRFGKNGRGNGEFGCPDQVLSANGKLYISDYCNCRIQVFDEEEHKYVYSFVVENPSNRKVYMPCGICVGPDRLLYVACIRCVLVFTLSGEYVASISLDEESGLPAGVAVDADGIVYVCCSQVVIR